MKAIINVLGTLMCITGFIFLIFGNINFFLPIIVILAGLLIIKINTEGVKEWE